MAACPGAAEATLVMGVMAVTVSLAAVDEGARADLCTASRCIQAYMAGVGGAGGEGA